MIDAPSSSASRIFARVYAREGCRELLRHQEREQSDMERAMRGYDATMRKLAGEVTDAVRRGLASGRIRFADSPASRLYDVAWLSNPHDADGNPVGTPIITPEEARELLDMPIERPRAPIFTPNERTSVPPQEPTR